MRAQAFPLLALLAAAIAISGCSHTPRDTGFDHVQKEAALRTDQTVQWRRGEAEDRAVAAAIDAVLARPLTVDEAVQIALLNNRGLQATYEELGIAQADLVQAGLLRNPVFFISTRFPDGGGGTNLEMDISQEFVSLIQLPLRKKLAAAALEAATSRVTHAVVELAADARVAYYQLQGAEQLLEMRRTIEQATAAAWEAARRLHEAGNISDLDLANQQALHEQAALELADADLQAFEAHERLNGLMGLWGEQTQWTIPSRLPDLPAAEVPPQGLESLAVARRLDLAAAAQEIIVAARRAGLARPFAAIPQIDVGVDTERDPAGGWVTGPNVSLPIPLFDQGQAQVARTQSQLRQARQRYYALAVDIRTQVRAAAERTRAARARSEYYSRVILPLRQRIVEQTQRQYDAMQIGVFQLLQARQAQVEAGRSYVEAMRDYWVARSNLERAVGGKLPAASPMTRPATGPATAPAAPAHQHGAQP